MTVQHWLIVGGFLVATGSLISGLDHYDDLRNPSILGAIILQLGSNILAVFTPPPKPKR